jgi:hypothetical protein
MECLVRIFWKKPVFMSYAAWISDRKKALTNADLPSDIDIIAIHSTPPEAPILLQLHSMPRL